MISLSLRLPKSLLNWVRAQARTQHIKPTQLIRRWIEEHRGTGEPSLEQRVRRLEDLVQRSGEDAIERPGEPGVAVPE